MFSEKTEWLVNRFQGMGYAEIISRLADVGSYLSVCASGERIQRRAQRREGNSYHLFKVPQLKDHPDGIPLEVQEDVIAAATQWRYQRGTFFGLRDVQLGDSIDWHRDYSSGVIGPMTYSGLINHRDISVVGNVKYIWELNRLQHLVLFALAWLYTDNSAYGEEIERQVLSWSRKNPFMKGVNWKSPFEAAIRLISWAYVSFLTANVNGGERNLPQGPARDDLPASVFYQKVLLETFIGE